MRRPIRRLGNRIGFRGATLLLLAVVDFAYGRTFIAPDPGQVSVNRYLAQSIPWADPGTAMWVWACLWWAVGAACLVGAFLHFDWWAYGAAVSLKGAYIAAIIIGGTKGMPNSTARSIVWGGIACWVLIEAFRAEPHRDIREVVRDMDESGEIPKVTGGGDGA